MKGPAASGDRDALLQQAGTLRSQQRVTEALAILARLQFLQPRFSRLYQERGHCHVLQRDAPAAIAALREAVRLNPALPASWNMLEQLHRMLGNTAEASHAARQLAMLGQLPVDIVAAQSLFADGDLARAADVLRDYLRQDAGNAGAAHLLARIQMERGEPGEAEDLLRGVIARAPDYHAARFDYSVVLLQQQSHREAREQAAILLGHHPQKREYLKQYAAACVAVGDHEPVIGLYEKLLDGQPQAGAEVADLRLWRANALKIAGRQEEAVADYHAALAARADYAVAWFSLANLKTYRFSDDEIARLRTAEARPGIPDADRIYLCFALGKALEDRGDYAASWTFYQRGNDLRRRSSRYQPDVAADCARRMKQVFSAEFFASRAGFGAADRAPIFIVGLPRSGSTLIEQILASHSAVEGTQELTLIDRYAAEICGRDPLCGLPLEPEAIRGLTAEEATAFGLRFLDETRVHRRWGRPFFIDKMPNNFWHIGLIHLILPQAIIIDVRREPMACCFGNLKQLFGTTNQEFSYGIDDVARHYRTYLDLMRHWDAVLPGRVLRVQYEDVVEDLGGKLHRILGHCGLPFEPACLAFHETQRSVRTPSSEQVRQPINRDGLARWRAYAPWLAPLEQALGDAATSYRA